MDLMKSIKISAAGMQSQGTRLRVISENIANADSYAQTPDGTPYQRKTVTFRNALDRAVGANTVRVHRILPDQSEFIRKYDPTHPAADAEGYIQTPNVKPLVELMDMREAERSYQANLSVIEVSKRMLQRTIDLLRN
jgi:flagellar basal-body rod protein FlgC